MVALENTATAGAYTSGPETRTANRTYPAVTATAAAPLIAQDLTVEKHAGDCTSPGQAFAPDTPVEWCVRVSNGGDAPAHNVTLDDLLPPDWAYVPGSATDRRRRRSSRPPAAPAPAAPGSAWDVAADAGPGRRARRALPHGRARR